MSYSLYRNPPSPDLLCQGDILDSNYLRENLRGHQDYFADRPHFYRYMILTQTCDLARDKDRADFIFLAVIRRLKDAIGIRQTEAKEKTLQLLRDLYNHNYNKRGFFYLPQDTNYGIDEESVVDLRVMFSIHKLHYPDLVKSRCGAINEVYSAQVGYMAGYMFNRVATSGWEELNPNGVFKDHIKEKFNSFFQLEEKKLQELLSKTNKTCAFSQCENEGMTYRWLKVRINQDDSVSQELVICKDHAKRFDDGSLSKSELLR